VKLGELRIVEQQHTIGRGGNARAKRIVGGPNDDGAHFRRLAVGQAPRRAQDALRRAIQPGTSPQATDNISHGKILAPGE